MSEWNDFTEDIEIELLSPIAGWEHTKCIDCRQEVILSEDHPVICKNCGLSMELVKGSIHEVN